MTVSMLPDCMNEARSERRDADIKQGNPTLRAGERLQVPAGSCMAWTVVSILPPVSGDSQEFHLSPECGKRLLGLSAVSASRRPPFL